MGPFSNALISSPSCPKTYAIYWGTSSYAHHCLKHAIRPIHGHVWHCLWTQNNKKPTQNATSISRRYGHRKRIPLFAFIVKFTHFPLSYCYRSLVAITNSFWGSRSENTCHVISWRFRLSFVQPFLTTHQAYKPKLCGTFRNCSTKHTTF